MVSKTLTLLGLSALWFTAPASAGTNLQDLHQSTVSLCHSVRPLARKMWQGDLYAVPPNVASIMVDAIDGKTAAVSSALAGMNEKDAKRWRQLAMYTAAFEGRTDTVGALLNDGAKADGWAQMPPLKAAFYHHLVGQVVNNRRIGPKTVKGLQATGLMNNDGHRTGLAMYMAINCDDLATAKVLLRHGADPLYPQCTDIIEDSFIGAVVDGDADITQAFLDQGADPCVEDRRLLEHAKEGHRAAVTVSSIGSRNGLPAALVQRLVCRTPHSPT